MFERYRHDFDILNSSEMWPPAAARQHDRRLAGFRILDSGSRMLRHREESLFEPPSQFNFAAPLARMFVAGILAFSCQMVHMQKYAKTHPTIHPSNHPSIQSPGSEESATQVAINISVQFIFEILHFLTGRGARNEK